MAEFIEKTAKTVQDAISLALNELNAIEENVTIEVLDEGNKGIFGLIGNKMAKVRVTMKEKETGTEKETRAQKAEAFLLEVFKNMNISADVELTEDDETILMKVTGKDIGIVIGRRGETLDSLQYLTSLVVNKDEEKYVRLVIDVENYRLKREETLVKLADRLAERALKYRKPVTLEPMNPYERRIIHSCLQENKGVHTYSVGDEPNRKIVIAPK
jgi:spoIIIJ-associated protein